MDKHQWRTTSSLQNISEWKGITPKGCWTCLKYSLWQNLANVVKGSHFWICNACSRTILQQLCFRSRYVLEAEHVSQLELDLFLYVERLQCSLQDIYGKFWSHKRHCFDVNNLHSHVRGNWWTSQEQLNHSYTVAFSKHMDDSCKQRARCFHYFCIVHTQQGWW